MQIFKNPNFDFLGKAWLFVGTSVLLMVLSAGYIGVHHLRYGVEFSEGTQVIVKFTGRPRIDAIRAAVEKHSPGATIQTYGREETNQVLIRITKTNQEAPTPVAEPSARPQAAEPSAQPQAGAVASAGDAVRKDPLTADAEATLQSLAQDYKENAVVEYSTDIVGPVVGAELRKKAVQLTLWGLLFQLIYIAWRFKGMVWGSAATFAVFHDVLITLGLLTLVGYEVSLNVIAAMLTLVGYSVNDTIVLFDRIRENLRQRRKEPLAKIVNDSVNQTLSRTLISNGTTFLAVLGLYFFGGEVLEGFGFAMVVGIVIGTYSSIYIASPIVIWWLNFQGKSGTGQTAKAAL